MDRYYTMRPINLAGEVSGYRAELVGVGAGADALRTIMQTAIQRVGVSITPVVCQQLFIEVFNAAVDFACDSGTSVNLADIISFKWNTRGKYDRVDATVPKSALSLTAVVSPKITRNATPHFDLKLQPVDPTITWIKPLLGNDRGVFARGMSLANIDHLRYVSADNLDLALAKIDRLASAGFAVSSNGRELIQNGDLVYLAPVEEGQRVVMQYATASDPSVFHTLGTTTMRAWAPRVIFDSATPQPFDIAESGDLVILGSGFERVATHCDAFDLATGNQVLRWDSFGAGTDEMITLPGDSAVKVAPSYTGGTLKLRFYSALAPAEIVGEFNVAFAAF